ncbi:MAG: iron-containing alcohol dehydrogenase, partial [Vicinamibacteria bacterium]
RAISMCLPTVVRFNAPVVSDRYRELLTFAGISASGNDAGEAMASRLEALAHAGGLPSRLRDEGIAEEEIPILAREAAQQWTGRFNPRPFDESAALEVYRCAF